MGVSYGDGDIDHTGRSFLLPIAAAFLCLPGSESTAGCSKACSILTAALVLAMGVWMACKVIAGVTLTTWNNELRVDGLSALMVLVIATIALAASVYSVRYLRLEALIQRVGERAAAGRTRIFYGLVLWFLGTMLWGCVTNNVVMLYVAIEATTLTSGLLVAFFWDRRALEAGYKYLMLLTIGITFALFGCVLLYASAAATKQLSGSSALLISEIRRVAHLVPGGTAALAIAFLVIGFGTKAGIAPFHPWLPDAHAEAPTPISVLLSGVMIKMGCCHGAHRERLLSLLASNKRLSGRAGRFHDGVRSCDGIEPGRPEAVARLFFGQPDGVRARRSRTGNLPRVLRRFVSSCESRAF